MKGVHALLSGPDAVEVARLLRHVADQILVERCDCFKAWLAGGGPWGQHLSGCRGVQESGDIIKITLGIETQLMRKARWHARKEAKK